MENQTEKTGGWIGILKIFLVLVFLPIAAIWFVWKKTTWSEKKKWIATGVIVFLFLLVANQQDSQNKRIRENEALNAKVATLEKNLAQEKQKNVSQNAENILPATEEAKDVAPSQAYDVISVTDGDTIKVNIDGKIETLRLIGIDTPEIVDPRKPVQCFGKESSDKAKEILTGKKVTLQSDDTQGERDQYGRLLRYVFLEDGNSFNKKMIEDGFAHEYTYQGKPYKFQTEFNDAEKSARENKRGLWATDTCNGDTTKSAAQEKPVAIESVPQAIEAPAPAVAPQSNTSTTDVAPTPQSTGGVVKKSSTGICHAPGTTYYEKTKSFIAFDSISACLASGGRLPKR